jgi:hypothetical protein
VDVMDHYNKGDGIADPWLDKDMQPLALTEPEIDDVVAFLVSLTSPQYKKVGDEEYARQFAISKTSTARHRPGVRPEADAAKATSALIAVRFSNPTGSRSSGTNLSDQEEETRGRLSAKNFPNTPSPTPIAACGESCGGRRPVRGPKSFARLGAPIPRVRC